LLENATKHTPADTPIEIAARQEGHQVIIEVNDAGPGLPAVAPEKLFEPFERGSAESSVSGVGLGLALARRIVEAHGGSISAGPRSPRGAAFSIRLPAGQPPDVEAT
jgi:two-component system sensor histidine kinase KdpD